MGITKAFLPAPAPKGAGVTLRILPEKDQHREANTEIIDVDPENLRRLIRCCFEAGFGLLMSPTSDGGALSVTVYYDRKRFREYVSSQEEFLQLIDAIAVLAKTQRA